MNNEMDDFSGKPGVPNQFGLLGGEANSIQPDKRMLSAMTPTIVMKDDKPYFVVGSPGCRSGKTYYGMRVFSRQNWL